MGISLSTLRVSMEGDSSSYVASAKAVEEANKRMAETGQAAGASLAAQDAAAGKTGGTFGKLNRAYVDGYANSSKFYGALSGLQKQFESGNVTGDRAAIIYEGVSKRYGMVADAASLARGGNADFAKVVDTVNGRLQTNVVALNTTAQAHGGMTTQAMAAQHAVRGFTEMVIQGVPPTRAFAMEANNISYAMTGPGGLVGALKQGLGAFTQFLTPMTLAIGVPAAVAAGLYLLYSAVKAGELEFANLSDRIDSTIGQLHGLQSNAQLAAGIGQSDFLAGMEKFAGLVTEAQHGLGGLAQQFAVNGASARTFNEYLAKAADLVANAASQQEKYRVVQALGLPATYQWVQYLSQGGQAILTAANQANGFGTAAENEMIAKARKFDTEWAKAWDHFKSWAKTAVIDSGGWIDDLILKARSAAISFDVKTGGSGREIPEGVLRESLRGGYIIGANPTRLDQGTANQFYGAFGNTFSGGAAKPDSTKLEQDVKRGIDLQQQYIGLLGQTASIAQQVQSESLKIAAYEMTPGAIKLTSTQIDNLKELARERALGITQMKTQADTMRIEVGAFGPSKSAAGWKVQPAQVGPNEDRGNSSQVATKSNQKERPASERDSLPQAA